MTWQELLIDLRAAVHTRHPAALEAALERVAAHPELAANGEIPARLERDFLFPAGKILAGETVPADVLRDLQAARLTALRALAAVALAHRYAQGNLPLRVLRPCGLDARPEVRRALGRTLAAACPPEGLHSLGRAWLTEESPRLRHAALLALRGLPDEQGETLLPLLNPLHAESDPHAGEALVNLLAALGAGTAGAQVLSLLETWAVRPDANPWLIGRALSGRWAAQYAPRASALLDALEARHGASRHISNARRALKRHVSSRGNA